jgi:FixJ family two-component response regulator
VKGTANHFIAIVDDDKAVLEATSGLLRSNGFRTETFSSADEFLGSLLLSKAECLLLDVAMSGVSGLALQRHLIGEGNRIPIIFITARDHPGVRKEAIQAGAVDFLPKPFSAEALLEAIGKALGSSPHDERKTP